jgi:AcrR family transcriptional regulator
MSSDQRRYTLRARARGQARTHDRIVAATEALHREVGPARTTVAEIARRAGVQRLTVYKHFPTSSELFAACQHWFLSGHPPPNLLPADGGTLEDALEALYAWFRANRQMEHHIERDRRLLPELDQLLRAGADRNFDAVAAAWAGPGPAQHLVRLALNFSTWELLAGRGAADDEIAALFGAAVRGLAPARSGSAAPRSSPRRSR